MGEVIREYGGACLAMIGTIALFAVLGGLLFEEASPLWQVVQAWGTGGI